MQGPTSTNSCFSNTVSRQGALAAQPRVETVISNFQGQDQTKLKEQDSFDTSELSQIAERERRKSSKLVFANRKRKANQENYYQYVYQKASRIQKAIAEMFVELWRIFLEVLTGPISAIKQLYRNTLAAMKKLSHKVVLFLLSIFKGSTSKMKDFRSSLHNRKPIKIDLVKMSRSIITGTIASAKAIYKFLTTKRKPKKKPSKLAAKLIRVLSLGLIKV